MILPSVIQIAQICAAKAVRHMVLSPGSRCAPLTIAFARHPDIAVKTVSDERSAAFIALGMARQLRQATGLVCTSGSAAYNYAPAVAEAFFQQIPLLIFTADRPPEWIDQLDGQTIRQRDLYGRHVKASYELPVGQTAEDVWFAGRMISEAINLSQTYPLGPVHINVPLREPFYPEGEETIDFTTPVKVIEQLTGTPALSEEQYRQLALMWNRYEKKLIVCGQHMSDKPLMAALQQLSQEQQIPVVADIISNMHGMTESIRHADVFLSYKEETFRASLQPDLIVTFGLSVISKNLKLFLRKHPPAAHWHVQPAGTAADTFQSLTQVVHTMPARFFQSIHAVSERSEQQSRYAKSWNDAETKAFQLMEQLFKKENMKGCNEFAAVQQVLQQLPEAVNLHLANSMVVRYANLLGLPAATETEVTANRGTSGIDGSNSTAVGAALSSDRLTVLLTGDVAFFYDRNAFWHNYALPHLRIVLFNNHGGSIFRMIEGPGRQPELDEYFVTRQTLTAENTARDFGMSYQQIDLTVSSMDALNAALPAFFSSHTPGAGLLEIITDGKTNAAIFKQYKQLIHQHYGA